MIWPAQHLEDLAHKIETMCASQQPKYCYFSPLVLQENLPKELSTNPFGFFDISNIVGPSWQQVAIHESFETACLYIVSAHGSDIADLLWELRTKAKQDSVFVLWHWDNHVAYNDNYKSALACDINFISHNLGVPGYLSNPVSPIAAHIPSCSAQFGHDELQDMHQKYASLPRSDKGLFNYVIYENAPRAALMRGLSETLADVAEFKLMPSHDRTRYWMQSREARFVEWASYKCCVIVPLVADLSTRVFDALATGQIPIVPRDVKDLDIVIPPATQEALGIVRIENLDSQNVRAGISQAISNFDRDAHSGVLARLNYVLGQAMTGHRIQAMLQHIEAIYQHKNKLVFGRGANGIGAYVSPVEQQG